MNEIKELEKKIQIAKIKETSVHNKIKNDFFDLIKKIFENKNIKVIYWTQYTPFFNDGEECIFRVNDLCCIVSEDFAKIEDKYHNFIGNNSKTRISAAAFFYFIEEEIEDSEEGKFVLEIKKYSNISVLKNIKEFAEEEKNMETIFLMAKLSELMTTEYFEKILLDTLGNHVKVTITNDKNDMEVNIEGYEHD